MDYREYLDQYHCFFASNPNRCVFLGVPDRLGELPDPSIDAHHGRLKRAQALLEYSKRVQSSDLGFDEALDLKLSVLSLKKFIFDATLSFNGALDVHQRPTAGTDITDGIFFLFINDPRPANARLDNIRDRISCIPKYLEALRLRLTQPVQRWASIELEQVAGIPDLFETIACWGRDSGYPNLESLVAAINEANHALEGYSAFLKSLPTTSSFSIGEANTRELVRLRGIELSLEQLHQIAKDFLRKNQISVEALRKELVARYRLPSNTSPYELQVFLNHTFKVTLPNGRLEDVLDRYQEERERILTYIKGHDLFPVFPEQDMKILATPPFMAPSIPAGAMFSPPPFREGVKTSLVYLTLSEELLDEHTELSIPTMMIHEGIPGHHLQLATAARHPSIVRRHQDAMDQAEGWTTMLEDYMLDHGYLDTGVEEARFITKRDIARIGARVAIDLFFMTGDKGYLDVGIDVDLTSNDPFVAAGNLLKAVTGFTDSRVQAELNWYSQERGYPLSYLTGNHLVWELKRDVEDTLKDSMPQPELDRRFHASFLNAGNMPVSFLRKVFEHEGLLAT